MRRLLTGLAALAAMALTACDRTPTALDPVDPDAVAAAGAGVPATIEALDDAAERLLPALAAGDDARTVDAQLLAARAALHAGNAVAASAATDAALREVARLGADAAELDAIRLNLESARAQLRPAA